MRLCAGWNLQEGQLATQDTWPLEVAALLAHQEGVGRGEEGDPAAQFEGWNGYQRHVSSGCCCGCG